MGIKARRRVKRSASHGGSRAGISLLEVLISMFILVVGLASIASLIPVGRYEIGEGTKADRAAALGQAAFREVKVRRLLDQSSWTTDRADTTGPSLNLAPTDQVPPVAIDPLGLTHGFGN